MSGRRIVAVLVLALAASGVHAEAPEETFVRANEAYADGRFEEASELYRRLADLGFEDARLEYNLGNAEFKRGRLGAAVLHYERARRLDPADEDIAANLAYARSFAADRVERPPLGGALSALVGLQERIGPDAQAWIALGGVWLAAALLAVGLARPGRFRASWGWALAGILAATLVAGASWHATWTRLAGTPLAVVVHDAVEVLAGPGANNATLFTIHEGLTVEVRDDPGREWLQISLPNGLNGWVPRETVERV